MNNLTNEYKTFIENIKIKIKTSQIKAALKVNEELLRLYWDMAEMIVEKQKSSNWGDKIIENISKDLKKEFPNLKGFSKRNIIYMKKWYIFWSKEFVQQAVAQNDRQIIDQVFKIPWGHNIVIIEKIKDPKTAFFYVQKTIEENYSRNVLIFQIKSELHERVGNINNFKTTLPKLDSDLANELLKDPYNFDFLTLSKDFNEKGK
jgi:predicted nuclease of restriction endonuclease-like (RecB) superfamily